MNRISYYNIRLSKIVGVGHRNIDTYYFVLSSDKTPHKLISKSMRIDEDNQDELQGEVELRPTQVEIWNYDKMKMVERYETDFRNEKGYKWSLYKDNMEISIERRNQWEEEMGKKKGKGRKGEEEREEIELRGSKRSVRSGMEGSKMQKSTSRVPESPLPESTRLPPAPPRKTSRAQQPQPSTPVSKAASKCSIEGKQ